MSCYKYCFVSFVSCIFLVFQVCARPPNLLLISVDTCRPDRLGCYGHTRPTSPHIDQLAAEGCRFEEAISQAPSTLPSHASVFTSRYPSDHRANLITMTPLRPDVTTLAEAARAQGYRTAAFTGGGQMRAIFGLDRGFDTYFSEHQSDTIKDATSGFATTAPRLLEWLRQAPEQPFCALLHSFDIHAPYTAPEPFRSMFDPDYAGPLPTQITKTDVDRIIAASGTLEERDLFHLWATYDAGIRWADHWIGWVRAELEHLGRLEETILVVFSDHGEEFGEHGVWADHWHSLYREVIRVPLIIRYPPAIPPQSLVSQRVRLIDVAPTVAVLAGWPLPSSWRGRSIVPAIYGRQLSEPAVLTQRERSSEDDQPMGSALTDGAWSIFKNFGTDQQWHWAVYNVFHDPNQCYNLYDGAGEPNPIPRSPAQIKLYHALNNRVQQEWDVQRSHPAPPPVKLGAEILEELRGLGYLQP